MPDLIDRLIAMERKIIELERRQENAVRVGRITEVDPANGLVKVDVGTEQSPLISGWVPWSERAGGIKTWTPPSAGEQVRLVSPAGDMAQGWVDQGGFSNEQTQPHDKGDEHRMTIGDTSITATGDAVVIKAGKISLVGNIHLGSEGASRAASGIGHKDDDFDVLIEGASNVFLD